ncbi:MAG: DUF350 domain-containing protein [Syntrophobacteraceae bacterium]
MQDFQAVLIRFIVFPVLAMLIMYLVKLLDDARTPFNEDEEITTKGNLAVALRKSGIYLGIALGLSGAMGGASGGLLKDINGFLQAGAFMMAALYISFQVNDRIILWRVNNDQAVKEGNLSLGIVEFASYIGSGIIMHGSFSGEGGGIVAAAVFFLLAQAALVAAFFLYELITPRKIGVEIEERRNKAQGIDVAGMLVAFAIVLRASIAGPFTGWLPGLQGFGIYFVAGLIFLFAYRFIVNRLFLSCADYDCAIEKERNPAVAAVSSVMQVAMALMIAGLL